MPNLLVEIGVEELPVDCLNVIYDELAVKMRHKLETERVAYKVVKVEATPRRIALFIEGIAAMQEDRELEISGPSCEKCYDAQGNPTQVLRGFLKSKQAGEKDIETRETPKGKFVFLRKKEKGKPVADLLPELLKRTLVSLSFPKFMRWEATGFKFPRPVRWIVALLDKKKIPVQIADVKSGNKSYGHRFLAPQGFVIPKADRKLYLAELKRRHVLLPLETREAMIRGALRKKFAQKRIDEDLVQITAQLVEEPFFLVGAYSKEYLELPAEVLASCMKKNQKIFACCDAAGHLKNQFVAVMNGSRKGLPAVRADYENVLDSRLKDARYFYKMDTREGFEKKKSQLGQLVYLGKLGSMLDKTVRLEKMAGTLAEASGNAGLAKDLARAASLSKIDLVSHMVYEFPELQGTVGGEYAREAKEKEEVALAISTQYLPKNLTEDQKNVRASMHILGALFGIMDRLDLLVGALGSGIEPTGSQDPFALRRAGGAAVKLIRAFGLHFSLEKAIDENLKLYGDRLTKKDRLKERILKFLQERVVFEAGVKPGTRPFEILQAVMRTSFDDIAEVFKRFEALSGMDEKVLIKAAKVIQRTANMLKGYGKTPGPVNAGAFTEEQEKRLFEVLGSKAGEVSGLIEKKEYEKATRLFAEVFAKPLHEFFDRVLVNAEDAAVRENRMALVSAVHGLYARKLADLSLLSKIDEE